MVQRVHIDGLGRTKEDLLTYEISEVFRAKNLIDVSIVAAAVLPGDSEQMFPGSTCFCLLSR